MCVIAVIIKSSSISKIYFLVWTSCLHRNRTLKWFAGQNMAVLLWRMWWTGSSQWIHRMTGYRNILPLSTLPSWLIQDVIKLKIIQICLYFKPKHKISSDKANCTILVKICSNYKILIKKSVFLFSESKFFLALSLCT